VAVGTLACPAAIGGIVTGDLPDDAGLIQFRRVPSVIYSIVDGAGTRYQNLDPSGNLEWEQFRIAPLGAADHAAAVSPGMYRLHVEGMDLNEGLQNNLVAADNICGVDVNGEPACPARPYKVGDYVWYDENGDGVQDASESGIPGVLVNLLDGNGDVIATTTTDGSGLYSFTVVPGDYTVEVDASNFDPASVLDKHVSTTGGNSLSNTVVDADVLTYDFGYDLPVVGGGDGAIGDTVWLDNNDNGIFDAGDTPLSGVVVELRDAPNGTVLDTQTTDANGQYLFSQLVDGTYYVNVASTNPALTGLTQSAKTPAGVDDVNRTQPYQATIVSGSSDLAADFAYVPPTTVLCFEATNGDPDVGATVTYSINQVAGTATIRVTLARSFADTAYGTNSTITGWPGKKGRKFDQIISSDNLELTLKNGAGATSLRFAMDLLAPNASAPSGYATSGVTGGPGHKNGAMLTGSASNVLSVRTSISENLNNLGWTDFTNSPLVNADYTGSAVPGWDWDTWYEATVNLSAFGPSGFGAPSISALHSSPSKVGVDAPTVRPCD
jgi:hypothetical protein